MSTSFREGYVRQTPTGPQSVVPFGYGGGEDVSQEEWQRLRRERKSEKEAIRQEQEAKEQKQAIKQQEVRAIQQQIARRKITGQLTAEEKEAFIFKGDMLTGVRTGNQSVKLNKYLEIEERGVPTSTPSVTPQSNLLMQQTKIINQPKQNIVEPYKSNQGLSGIFAPSKIDRKLTEKYPKAFATGKEIVKFPFEVGSSVLKGTAKANLYFADELSAISQLRYKKGSGIFVKGGGDFKKASDILGTGIKSKLGYSYKSNPLFDPDIQTTAITAGFVGGSAAGGVAAGITKAAQFGFTGYQGYRTFKEPTAKNIAATAWLVGGPYLLGKITKQVKLKKGLSEAETRVIGKFGKTSPEYKQYKILETRAFKELPRSAGTTGKTWSSAQVEASWGNPKVQKITTEVLRKYKPEIVGSTTIKPQTSLKKLPRLKAGDVDIQNVPSLFGGKGKKFALELTGKLKQEGFEARMRSTADALNPGKTAYHVTLNGKEFVNIHGSSKYFLKTQAGPLLNWYESERIGAWTKDPYGVKMGNIRDQLRVKFWKGFVEMSRPKDIKDALGIKAGTDYLFKKTSAPKISLTKGRTGATTGFNKISIKRLYSGEQPKSQYSLGNLNKRTSYSPGKTYTKRSILKPTAAKYTKSYAKPKPLVLPNLYKKLIQNKYFGGEVAKPTPIKYNFGSSYAKPSTSYLFSNRQTTRSSSSFEPSKLFRRTREQSYRKRTQQFGKVKQPQAITPSLTASVFGIKGKTKSIRGKFKYGVLPKIRGI